MPQPGRYPGDGNASLDESARERVAEQVPAAAHACAGMVADDAETLDVHVPMELRRRGGRKEILLPPDAHTAADVGPRRPIVVALARAHKWQRMLDTGEMPGIAAIADGCGVDRTYVSRILALAMLSPSLVTAVLNGDEPDGLSLAKLHQGIPARWDRQTKGLS